LVFFPAFPPSLLLSMMAALEEERVRSPPSRSRALDDLVGSIFVVVVCKWLWYWVE
jgi:hypothetical protein